MYDEFLKRLDTLQRQASQGRYDLATDEVVAMVRSGQMPTLVPFLPGLLRHRNKPFTLDDHFHFEPLFASLLVKSIVCKTARQVGKSVSMLTSSSVRAGILSDFRVMYVTPLFSQVQRLSNEVARPLLRESPLGRLMSGSRVEESVLRRSFFNRSRIEFTFASLSADRVRGSSNDELNLDESFRGTTTYVETRAGRVLLKDIREGEEVKSFDGSGNIVWNKVVKNSFHGYRRCYRLHTASGRNIDATSESFVATAAGWLRVSEIIKRAHDVRGPEDQACGGEGSAQGIEYVHAGTGSDAARHSVGRRVRESGRVVHGTTRPETGRIHLDQVHRLARVRTRASFEIDEEQTRVRVAGLLHCDRSGIFLLQEPVLPEREKDGDDGVAGSDRPGRIPAGDRVVDCGRRVANRKQPVFQSGRCDQRLLLQGGGTATRLDDPSRLPVSSLLAESGERSAADALPLGRIDTTAHGRPATVHASEYALQVGIVRPAIDLSDLHFLRQTVLAEKGQVGYAFDLVLRGGGMPTGAGTPTTQRPTARGEAGEGGEGESQTRSRSDSRRESPAQTGRVGEKQPRQGSSGQAEVPPETETLEQDRLIAIEDVGEHDVYDIEVERDHCFVANGLAVSNCQDFRPDVIPVINETLSASEYGIIRKFGTPKTPENILEGEWRQSSQGVWCVPCHACGKDNLACLSEDLDGMIGPNHPDIGPNRPGTVCRRCSRPIWPTQGFWVHRFPDRRLSYCGYHVPQPVMPMHYANREKWTELLRKRECIGLYTPAQYQNEVLGESAGEGLQLITREQLQKASDSKRVNDPKQPRKAIQHLSRYRMTFLSVDWGGGGESGLSLTVPVVLGLTRDGKIEVVYATRLTTPNDHLKEARQVLELFRIFGCQRLVHDYTGAGALRETILVSAGVRREQIVPIQYVGGGNVSLMARVKPTERNLRVYYRLNKSRSLLYAFAAIRTGLLKFFAFDYVSQDEPGLICDFLSLYEERIEHKTGSNVYLIARNQMQTDDFAQAVNIGCAAIWYATKSWPKFELTAKYDLTADQLASLEPEQPWADAGADGDLEEIMSA